MTPKEKRAKEKLALTYKQKKAFRAFIKAYKKCKEEKIEFYTVLETVTAFNGKYLIRIHDEHDKGDINTQDLDNPSFSDVGFSGWADDQHFIEVDDR